MLTKKDAGVEGIYQDKLKGTRPGAIMVHFKSHFFLCLAHFKSGQSGLTKDQLQTGSSFLESSFPGSWAITGDMNWDYANRGALTLPGNCHAATCWADRTQVKGGLLDWCLVGGAYKVTPVDVNGLFPAETNDMTGPDHRPVIFSIEPA